MGTAQQPSSHESNDMRKTCLRVPKMYQASKGCSVRCLAEYLRIGVWEKNTQHVIPLFHIQALQWNGAKGTIGGWEVCGHDDTCLGSKLVAVGISQGRF